jgi:hypothetical protein
MAVAISENWMPVSLPGAEAAHPEASARAAGLRYVSDADPGIRRKQSADGSSTPTHTVSQSQRRRQSGGSRAW